MKNNKIIVGSYLIISLILILDVYSNLYGSRISLAGYWSDRILFWIWIIFTITILVKFRKTIFAKIYFLLIVIGLVLSYLPMRIPLVAIYLSSTGKGLMMKKQLTPEYRFQHTCYSGFGIAQYEIVKNNVITERTVSKMRTGVDYLDEAILLSETNDSLKLKLYEKGAYTEIISFSKK
ncbi:MAG TPA: hypothetical protein PKL92_01815 [Aquaticitalea sp.]|nr:hypothetical protein [Aquaticitalea sp.]